MAKEKKSNTPINRAGRPTGSYSSYGTSGYGTGGGYGSPYGGGYGSTGNGAYGRGAGPYGGGYGANNLAPQAANNVQQAQAPAVQDDETKVKGKAKANGKEKPEKATKADYSNMSRKDKKLAKKQAKFDESDPRYYPMTVGSWIGTFILLAIPLINGICAICWFFGVGNKSRAAWVRSKVVIFLLVIVLIVGIFGGTFLLLTNKAKNVEVKIDGVSYGTCGDYKVKGTLYYLACLAVDTFGDQIIGKFIGGESGGEGSAGSGDQAGSGNQDSEVSSEESKNAIKAMLAEKILGIKIKSNESAGGGGGGEPESGEPVAAAA